MDNSLRARLHRQRLMERRYGVALVITLLFSALCLPSPRAGAAEFSGFASFGGGVLDVDDLTLMDYNDDPSFDSDTIVGVQLQTELSDRWRLTTQVVSRGYRSDGHHDYEPDLEWLFLTYQWSANFRARAGKLRTPIFLHSEDLEVGYAYPWVRPPIDVYALNVTPFSNYEGADASYFQEIFGAEWEFQLFAGSHDEEYLESEISGHYLYGAVTQVRQDSWTARLSFLNAMASYENPDLALLQQGLDLIALSYPIFVGTSKRFEIDHQWVQYYSVAAEWEQDRWTVTTEANYIDGPEHGLSSQTAGGYLSVARQFGRWQPYVVVSRLHSKLVDEVKEVFVETYESVPAQPGSLVDLVRAGSFQVIDRTEIIENIYTLGTRFELMPKIALKGQVDKFHLGSNSIGQFVQRPSVEHSDNVLLYSFTLDMVF